MVVVVWHKLYLVGGAEVQWVETNPSNISKHLYFPFGHLFLLPHGTTLTAFDADVLRENTDVRWVAFHPPAEVISVFVYK
jgi:hypothetical protein